MPAVDHFVSSLISWLVQSTYFHLNGLILISSLGSDEQTDKLSECLKCDLPAISACNTQ
jgi:hypothetical protein